MSCKYTLHWSVSFITDSVAQGLICAFQGPGTKGGDGSGMCVEEGDVTEHSAVHIGGPA